MISEKQIVENYNIYIQLLKKVTTEERYNNIIKLLTSLNEEHVATAPASAKKHYHGAYHGGLIVHLLNVYTFANQIYEMWKINGSDLSGYDKNELLFTALTHDIGKLGTVGQPFYILQTDNWRRDKLGELYTYNPDIAFLRHSDRTLYLFQEFNIKLTENEYIGIYTHDGLFDVKNEIHFKSSNPNQLFKTNLPFILHQADYMAYRIETENERDTTK